VGEISEEEDRAVKKSKREVRRMWKKCKVTLHFPEKVCGSVPFHKELVSAWLTARAPAKKPEEGPTLPEMAAEVEETIEEAMEKVTLGFQGQVVNGDKRELFVRGGTLKAHMKDCANQIKENLVDEKEKDLAIKALRSKVANKVYVDEYRVFFTRNGNRVLESSGSFEQPVHVITPKGPRNSLKIIHYLENVDLIFTLKYLEDDEVTKEVIEQIFEYGSLHGYGGERGMGEGRYEYKLDWE
jgi:hypothetical protein